MAAAGEADAEDVDVEELVPDEMLPKVSLPMKPALPPSFPPTPRRKKGGGAAGGAAGGGGAAGSKGRQKRRSKSRAAKGDGEAEPEGEEAEAEAVAFGRRSRRAAEPTQREVRAVPAAEVAPRRAKPPAQGMDLMMLQEPALGGPPAGLGGPPAAAPRRSGTSSSTKSPMDTSLPRGKCDMD